MPTVKYELELNLPTLKPAELAKICRESAMYMPTEPCPICWFPSRCLLDAHCSNVKAKHWRDFLKYARLKVEEEMNENNTMSLPN